MPSRRRLLFAIAGTGLVAGCLTDRTTESTGTPTDSASTTSTTVEDTATPTANTANTATPSEHDRVAWRRSLPGLASGRPSLSDERVFVGSDDGSVTALSTADGGVDWQFETPRPVRGSPAVDGGHVLAVTRGVESGGHDAVRAIAVDAGEERWSFEPNDWRLTVLGTHDGTVFVATSDDVRKSSGQNLFGLALSDGTERWSVEVGDNSGGLVADGTVYVPSTDAVEAVGVDGSRRWEYEGDEYQFGSLSVTDSTVAFATGSSPDDWVIRGVDTDTGDERWSFDDWVAYTTHAADGRLFVGGRRVARLDPERGDVEWTTDRRAPLYGAVADGSALYVGGRSAAALAVDDGAPLWTADVEASRARPVGLTAGRLLLRTPDADDNRNRRILALDAADGDRAWAFTGDHELTRPAVSSGRVYVVDGSDVLAFDV